MAKNPMRDALKETLLGLKAQLRGHRAKKYFKEEKDEEDEPTEMASRRDDRRDAGAGAGARGDDSKVAEQEGREKEGGVEELEEWRSSQKDFMRNKKPPKKEGVVSKKMVQDFMFGTKPKAPGPAPKGADGKFQKKREVIS